NGAALYAKYCALCHGAEAKGYAADNAPSLVTPQFLSAADDSFIANSIALGRPGSAMAAYAQQSGAPLTEHHIDDLAAFLRAHGPAYQTPVKRPPGSAKAGARVYAENSAKCHGDRRARGAAIYLANPVFLGLASDDFLYDSIARGRDGTEMKAFAGE